MRERTQSARGTSWRNGTIGLHAVVRRAAKRLGLAVVAGIAITIPSTDLTSHASAAARVLSFNERVSAQKAIEQVFWRHRTWPADNSGAKPRLSEMVPDEMLRAKVEDYLNKSNALVAWWQRPITAAQLQAEMDRMAAGTRDPKILQELFDALGNDPFVIAETLARQMLADRLIRDLYSHDERLHGATRAKAANALARCTNEGTDCLRRQGAEVCEVRWLDGPNSSGPAATPPKLAVERGARRIELSRDDFADLVTRLSQELDTDDARKRKSTAIGMFGSEEPRTGTPGAEALIEGFRGPLIERDDSFEVTEVVEKGDREISAVVVRWSKGDFCDWWKSRKSELSLGMKEPAQTYAMTRVGSSNTVVDTWTATSTGAGVPTPRFFHTAVWTGAEMIVWGGGDGGPVATGARYDPATDSWTPTSTGAGVPSARRFHTAVWTGTRMIIWGGSLTNSEDDPTDTGASYNPMTDTWTPTSLTGVPVARQEHTAVWTGSKMIVWGGLTNSFTSTKTGGQYDPAMDTWTSTTYEVEISARFWHTAIWTGSEMIVWGGESLNNRGDRYNPSTNVWTPMTTTNAPEPRFYHSAVWTGTEMIVWGGETYYPDFNEFDSGGRYNPATDTWTSTSLVMPPRARSRHTAVWTGSEMIVWGGFAQRPPIPPGGRLNSGGVYDPSDDSWTPTSLVDVPPARLYHSAVWRTGQDMIVWGGFTNVGVGTGGRYAACATPTLSYRDDDGDGYGNPAVSTTTCNGSVPVGYVSTGTDCDDSSAATFPGAPEVNDGQDNQCSGDTGYGTADEISGISGFTDSGNRNLFCWPSQAGATMYQVVRSPSPQFPGGSCFVNSSATSCFLDPAVPAGGQGYYYLVRPLAPFAGSWGRDGQGSERTGICGL